MNDDPLASCTTHFRDPHLFLESLRTSSDKWGIGWQTDWIFRGHADATWELLPSAFRATFSKEFAFLRERLTLQHKADLTNLRNHDTWFKQHVESDAIQTAIEIELIHQFSSSSDDCGLHTPDLIAFPTAGGLIQKGSGAAADFRRIIKDNIELFALAQHHGIPTRLLDWSESAWNAAFFAAKDCFDILRKCTASNRPRNIAVWAMRKDPHFLNLANGSREIYVFESSSKSRNSYLRAQRGVFTCDMNSSFDFHHNGLRSPLEELLHHHLTPRNEQRMVRFTLGINHVPELLKLLFRERIGSHSLMPSYETAASSAKMYDIWHAAACIKDWYRRPEFRLPLK